MEEGFSTLKSLFTEHPPGMNIFKGGSCTGSSTTTCETVFSALVSSREADGFSFCGTAFEVFAISLKNGREIEEERKSKA